MEWIGAVVLFSLGAALGAGMTLFFYERYRKRVPVSQKNELCLMKDCPRRVSRISALDVFEMPASRSVPPKP